MQFLFHTVILWEDELVYYTIHQLGAETYFAEIHDNPKSVGTACDFIFYRVNSEWKTSAKLCNRQLYWLVEAIEYR